MADYPGSQSARLAAYPGKPWSGGSLKPKLVLHSTETRGLPNYTSPPHLTANLDRVLFYQHVPFDRAAYSIRSSAVESLRYVYQVELIGYAADIPNYSDRWYAELSKMIAWFTANLGVPRVFADFSVMQAGATAPQRMTLTAVDSFSGVLGHGHVGRGIDTHWDPGKLDVARLETVGPPPPSNMEAANMAYADTLSTEDWVMLLAPSDIDRHFDLGIQQPDTEDGRTYWKGLIPRSDSNPTGTKTWAQLTTQERAAWENYRRTLSARTPYYT